MIPIELTWRAFLGKGLAWRLWASRGFGDPFSSSLESRSNLWHLLARAGFRESELLM